MWVCEYNTVNGSQIQWKLSHLVLFILITIIEYRRIETNLKLRVDAPLKNNFNSYI